MSISVIVDVGTGSFSTVHVSEPSRSWDGNVYLYNTLLSSSFYAKLSGGNLFVGDQQISGSVFITGSNFIFRGGSASFFGDFQVNGNYIVSGNITINSSSVILSSQTSSMTVLSSSYASTASYALNSISSSYSSMAATASYFSGSITNAISASYATQTLSSSYNLSSSYSLSSSYIEWGNINSKPSNILSSSAQISSDISGAFTSPSTSFSIRITNLEITSSNNTSNIDTLTSATSSYILISQTGSILQPYLLISSTSSMLSPYLLSSQTSSFINASQTGSMTVLSASYANTSSYAHNAGSTIDTGSFATTSSLNSFTSSYYLNSASFALSQLDSRNRKIYLYNNQSNGITGTTSEVVVRNNLLIPSGTMGLNSVFNFEARFNSTGTAGNKTYRVYLNTSDNLSGSPVLIATGRMTSGGQIYGSLDRRMPNRNSPSLNEILDPTVLQPSDKISSTGALTTIDWDWSVDTYVIVTMQLSNSADQGRIRDIQIYINEP